MQQTLFDRIKVWLSAIPFFGAFLSVEELMGIYRSGTPYPHAANIAPAWVPRLPPEWFGKLYVTPQFADDYTLYLAILIAGLFLWGAAQFVPGNRAVSEEVAPYTKPRGILDVIGLGFVWAGACAGASSFALLFWIQANGSLRPDRASGRTYPVDSHGYIYVWPLQGWLYDHLLMLAVALVAVGALIYARRDIFSR